MTAYVGNMTVFRASAVTDEMLPTGREHKIEVLQWSSLVSLPRLRSRVTPLELMGGDPLTLPFEVSLWT